MAEAHVLNLIEHHNKPFGVQGIVDNLQTQGIKKTAAQKALDALVEGGKITVKVRARCSCSWRGARTLIAWAS
jgi:6-phosphogluconate dehydrogenase